MLLETVQMLAFRCWFTDCREREVHVQNANTEIIGEERPDLLLQVRFICKQCYVLLVLGKKCLKKVYLHTGCLKKHS